MAEKPSIAVSDFAGIDRNTYSTKLSKRLFNAQNAYPRIPGIISKVPGCDYFTDEVPGVEKIIEIFPFYRTLKERMLLAYCNMKTIDDPTAPLNLTEILSGGVFDAEQYGFFYSWVGCGGETKKTNGTLISVHHSSSISIEIPAYPTGARRINFYCTKVGSGKTYFVGSSNADAGTSYVVITPFIDVAPLLIYNTVSNLTGYAGGSLEQGTYFIYTCPFKISSVVTESIITLQPGQSKITMDLDVPDDEDYANPIAIFVGTQRYLASFYGVIMRPASQPVFSEIDSMPENSNATILIKPDFTLGFKQINASVNQNTTGNDGIIVFDKDNKFSREIMLVPNSQTSVGGIPLGITSYARFVNILDRCFFTNNVAPVCKTDGYIARLIGQTCDGTTGITDPTGLVINPAQNYNLPLICSKIFNYRDQLIIGGGVLGDDYYYASLPGDPDVFTRDRSAVQVNAMLCSTSRGDRIEGFGMATTPGDENGPGTQLIIGKTNSIHYQNIIPLFPGMGSPKKIIYMEDGVISDKAIVATEFGTIIIGRKKCLSY